MSLNFPEDGILNPRWSVWSTSTVGEEWRKMKEGPSGEPHFNIGFCKHAQGWNQSSLSRLRTHNVWLAYSQRAFWLFVHHDVSLERPQTGSIWQWFCDQVTQEPVFEVSFGVALSENCFGRFLCELFPLTFFGQTTFRVGHTYFRWTADFQCLIKVPLMVYGPTQWIGTPWGNELRQVEPAAIIRLIITVITTPHISALLNMRTLTWNEPGKIKITQQQHRKIFWNQ